MFSRDNPEIISVCVIFFPVALGGAGRAATFDNDVLQEALPSQEDERTGFLLKYLFMGYFHLVKHRCCID